MTKSDKQQSDTSPKRKIRNIAPRTRTANKRKIRNIAGSAPHAHSQQKENKKYKPIGRKQNIICFKP